MKKRTAASSTGSGYDRVGEKWFVLVSLYQLVLLVAYLQHGLAAHVGT